MSTIRTLCIIAKNYRRDYSLTPAGGVVLIYEGSAYGWRRLLGESSSERPGAFAVDESGSVWIARGGDDYNGAASWHLLSPLPGQNDQSASLAAPAEADHVEDTPTPTLEQFQRWLETVAHMASRNIVPGAFSARCLVNSSLVSECRIATKLLIQFKHETDK